MSQVQVESARVGKFTINSACAPFLRLKYSSALVLAIAGDEACIGTADIRAHASGDPMTVYDINAPGTQVFVANGAIAIGDDVSSAAAGKIQTGTAGAHYLGKALTATTGDGQQIEVLTAPALAGSVARGSIVQQDLVPYTIPFTSLRVHDALQTNLPGTSSADDMAIITGTQGTDSPTLQGVDFGGTTTDEKSAFEFVLPPEYVAGETITARVRGGMVTGISDTACTVDVECWKAGDDGAAGSDICATAAQSINSLTYANKDFTITPTGLAPGDRLQFRLSFAGSDTGNLVVMIPEISKLQILLDIKG